MSRVHSAPYVGQDNVTSPGFDALIAGKDGSGKNQDILVGTDGSLNVNLVGSSATVTVTGSLTLTAGTTTTGTFTNVNGSSSSVTLLSLNTNRKTVTIFNDSTSILYVKFGATASATSFTYRLISNSTLEFPQPIYTGQVDGIWVSATGAARVTEMT